MPIIGTIASSWRAGTAFESIATTTVGSGGASSVVFNSIPSTYTHLQLRCTYGFSVTNATREVFMRFNSDNGTNYSEHMIVGNGSSVAGDAKASQSGLYIGQADHSQGAGTSAFGVSIVDIFDYSNTNKNTTHKDLWGWENNVNGVMRYSSGMWINTTTVSSITLTPLSSGDFRQHSIFALYGIRGA